MIKEEQRYSRTMEKAKFMEMYKRLGRMDELIPKPAAMVFVWRFEGSSSLLFLTSSGSLKVENIHFQALLVTSWS